MDWHVRFLGAGHRIAGHSLQMLDAIELLLGSKARREALLHLLVDAHIVRMNNGKQRLHSAALEVLPVEESEEDVAEKPVKSGSFRLISVGGQYLLG
jgi:hypothetical protein